jgi:putative heme-binding domain-containing protein
MGEVLALVPTADERRGQKVFHSTKAACIACHQMGYLGGNIGPSLNRIGNIRRERDLIESIMFPSASFVRSYEPVTVIMSDGKVHNGQVRDETATELILALDAQKVARISKSEIDERIPGKTSVMPAGLDRQFSNQDLADLIHFLKVSR